MDNALRTTAPFSFSWNAPGATASDAAHGDSQHGPTVTKAGAESNGCGSGGGRKALPVFASMRKPKEFFHRRTGVVYFLLDDWDALIYVGQTINLAKRIPVHECQKKPFNRVLYYRVPVARLERTESVFIALYRPPLNYGYGQLQIRDFDESDVAYVVGKFFGGDWSLVPPLDQILSHRPKKHRSAARRKAGAK